MKTTFTILSIAFLLNSFGQDGKIDASFGYKGRVLTPMSSLTMPTDIAVQTDGKILIAGRNAGHTGGQNLFIRRYKPNGMVDESFGEKDGKVTVLPMFRWLSIERVALSLQNENIFLAGGEFDVFKFNAQGIHDPSFRNVDEEFYTEAIANDLKVLPDGNIVVAGTTDLFGTAQLAVLKYLTNGNLDSTFGVNGKALTSVGLGNTGIALSLAVLTDGKIIVGGVLRNDNYDDSMLLARYLPNGLLDENFGNGGLVITALPEAYNGFGSINSIALQADGKIVAGGSIQISGTHSRFVVLRYTNDGTLDPTFHNTGFLIEDASESCNSLKLQTDEKIIAGGSSYVGELGKKYVFMIKRYTTSGDPDSSFGQNGQVLTNVFPRQPSARLDELTLQPDGKIAATGTVYLDDRYDIGITRYLNQGATASHELVQTVSDQMATTKEKIKISPNPVPNFLYISGLDSHSETIVSVLNPAGQLINRKVVRGESCTLNVGKLDAGIYFITLLTDNKIVRKQFIKQ